MFDLVVLGEINPDLILNDADIVPQFGQVEKFVDHAALTIGSSSVITACGAARLGLRVAFVGVVGDDLFGRFMLDEMQAAGIDIRYCRIDSTLQTGFTVILAQQGHDRAMLTYSGSIAALSRDHIDPVVLTKTPHLHVGSYFLLDAIRADLPALFAQLHAQNVTISLDTNYDPRNNWDISPVVSCIDLLLPNSAEVTHLTGKPLDEGISMLRQQVPLLAVKMGRAGGRLVTCDATVSAPIVSGTVVDTVGAGDSFNAGALWGFLSQKPPQTIIRAATICGSLSTRGAGGTATQATLAELHTHLNRPS